MTLREEKVTNLLQRNLTDKEIHWTLRRFDVFGKSQKEKLEFLSYGQNKLFSGHSGLKNESFLLSFVHVKVCAKLARPDLFCSQQVKQ